MSSSSDIEKLFDHFGGDANAYQEIGRENEARSARTRWPLLVTLDLTQPAIPAIGQPRAAVSEALAQNEAPAADRQDTTPKDTASVTRARAPLFTRSHRRDIPPVVVAAQQAAPAGASRFGAPEANDHAAQRTAQAGEAAQAAQAAPAAARIDVMTSRTEIPAATPRAVDPAAVSAPAPSAVFAPVPSPVFAPAPAPIAPVSAPVPSPAFAFAATPVFATAPAPVAAPAWAQAPAAPKPPASILGKLFAPEPALAPPQPAGRPGESAPLQSVFDRLRGTPAQTAAAPPAVAPRAATPAASNSWLVNGPRRS
ncbi:cellulose biosynthesis protein BcsP [Paraburkholderia haematera]|uniref:Cellulose biosynthesis protein BcsR n=1 Tax=Paraburkholderia haematera TaxID=2793077 RepID=A0ABN7MGA3_9BURK|nr:cellulose biosynthesis protein BcsP [Paraburkholderia haematera]CAE6797183.1 hypothetical protein R69888_05031 [Paraburkholderia haematera]